jgi:hypothetical protein
MMRKGQHSGILICLVMIAMLLAGCNSSSGSGTQTANLGKTPVVTPTSAVETPTTAAATPTVVAGTPNVTPTPVSTVASSCIETGASDYANTGAPRHFVGDRITLTYPSSSGCKVLTTPGQSASHYFFVYPSAPNSGMGVDEHNEDQDPGLMAEHVLLLTQAEMVQVATNSTSFTFTSAHGITWTGWDSTITLSHTYPGFGKYHVRILVHNYQDGQKCVVGIIAPETGYQDIYRGFFLPMIQSLALK